MLAADGVLLASALRYGSPPTARQVLGRFEALRDRDDVGRPACARSAWRCDDRSADGRRGRNRLSAIRSAMRSQAVLSSSRAAQHRLLGLDRVRRQLEHVDLRVLEDLGDGLGHVRESRYETRDRAEHGDCTAGARIDTNGRRSRTSRMQAARRQIERGSPSRSSLDRLTPLLAYCSPSTDTLMCAFTSVCRSSAIS